VALKLDWIRRDEWQTRARCTGRSDLFFPMPAERPSARRQREHIAAALCAGCVVRTACRDFGRQHREYGLWGGENEEQRVAAGCSPPAPIGVSRVKLRSVVDRDALPLGVV
jgi:WhiB family transcriptional regulator, redox-sensing transcriptional regulator